MTTSTNKNSFSNRIIDWQRQFGRHDLPWQNNAGDPYRVWVSEIMLQQTQVDMVLGYYDRFLTRFPDVVSLASAGFDDVAAVWTGLGYYARAGNLHKAAKMIMTTFDGRFPTDPTELEKLPGVGRSTASAIAGFAFGVKAAILDGNVKRVLCRHHAINTPIDRSATLKTLWQLAENLLPNDQIASYHQGLMDLGSQLCTRRRPACQFCPVQTDCQAFIQGATTTYPVKSAPKTRPLKPITLLAIRREDCLLFEKRPDHGIWGNLWSFPELSLASSASDTDIVSEVQRRFQLVVKPITRLASIDHELTHFRLKLYPILCQDETISSTTKSDKWRWLAPYEENTIGLPKPVLDLWRQLVNTTLRTAR